MHGTGAMNPEIRLTAVQLRSNSNNFLKDMFLLYQKDKENFWVNNPVRNRVGELPLPPPNPGEILYEYFCRRIIS